MSAARLTRLLLTAALIIAILVPSLALAGTANDRPVGQDKIASDLRAQFTATGSTAFFVVLRDQADLSGAAQLGTKAAKGQFVFDQLNATATRTQAGLRALLDARGIPYKSYFVRNMILVAGDQNLANELAARSDVASVEVNTWYKSAMPTLESPVDHNSPNAIEPGVNYIQAPAVWALGFTGQGMVVAGADTGVAWDHPAIKGKYRGWNGSSADHNYNWHDGTCAFSSFMPPGTPCASPNVPTDPHGHGTHTVGTMVGDDGGSNQIGVAPGAKWVACRNLNDQGWGTRAWYADCFQFFIAPTNLGGTNPNPAMSPDVINNSWGCPDTAGGEDCNDPANDLVNEVNATRAAGIMVVASAGNDGPGCGTVNTPIAIYDGAYSVGALSASTGNIASFSSRGPSAFTNLLKPDISAPGVSVRSSVPPAGYGSMSGTSMAGPHVAGAVALLWSAHPNLVGNIDATEALFNTSATPRTTTQECGGVPGSSVPNNTFGYGAINVLAAVQQAPTAVTVSNVAVQPVAWASWAALAIASIVGLLALAVVARRRATLR